MSAARTLYQKIWDMHEIERREDGTSLLFVDRHIINEATSAQAFAGLRARRLAVARREMHLAVADHVVPTLDRALPLPPGRQRDMIEALERDCKAAGLELIPFRSADQGICHVIAPEQGFVLPGMLVVCGDSHTATLGALGTLAFGIGTSEVEHVLATGAIVQQRPKMMAIEVSGALPAGVTAKDLILTIIGKIGAGGGTGYAMEYRGSAIRALSIESRMTLCNMSIEAGARTGMVAPDGKTLAWLKSRPRTPQGGAWDAAAEYWQTLASDPDASFDHVIDIDGNAVEPQVTWGTSPEQVISITGRVPDPAALPDRTKRAAAARAIAYQQLQIDQPIEDIKIDRVFIGSCTNARLGDLRDAADFLRGRHLAAHVDGFVVPGSTRVKRAAEAEGLAQVFIEAGFEWRDSGCSMCGGGDPAPPGTRVAATSNRNFEHRQGRDVHTHIVSPAMAAAAGVAGHFVDIRKIPRTGA